MSSLLMRRAAAAPRAVRAFSTTPSRSVARLTIIGHLADAPEVAATSTGNSIIRYTVASNHGPRDNRQTSWFRVVSFLPEGPGRDYVTNLPKGTLVYVDGDASMNTFQDSEGKNRSALNIVQRHIEALRRPSNTATEALAEE